MSDIGIFSRLPMCHWRGHLVFHHISAGRQPWTPAMLRWGEPSCGGGRNLWEMMIERRDRKKGMPRNLVPLKIQTRLYQVSKLLELFAQVNGIKTQSKNHFESPIFLVSKWLCFRGCNVALGSQLTISTSAEPPRNQFSYVDVCVLKLGISKVSYFATPISSYLCSFLCPSKLQVPSFPYLLWRPGKLSRSALLARSPLLGGGYWNVLLNFHNIKRLFEEPSCW